MKNFLAFLILAICMLVVMPPGNQVQASNNDHVNLVADHGAVLQPAMVYQHNMIDMIVPGSLVVEKTSVNRQVALKMNSENALPNEMCTDLFYVMDDRICNTLQFGNQYLKHKLTSNSQGLLKIFTVGQNRIRADTLV